MSPINFWSIVARAGNKEGARATFEKIVVQLVRLQYPNARNIEARPGDWGLDTIVGQLDSAISVWQCKFFIDGIGEVQKAEIRESFDSLMNNASKRGYKVNLWTLCIPCNMSPDVARWWDGWTKRMEKKYGVTINRPWDETELEALLMTPDAAAIRSNFFGDTSQPTCGIPRPFEPLPEGLNYDDMLFIKQLVAAQIDDLDSAKEQFFNHDLLAREVADKGVKEEIDGLRSCAADLRSIWAPRFNRHYCAGAEDDHGPELYNDVMSAIEAFHNARHPTRVPMSLVHRCGSMHQVVEDGRAGWIRSYRDLVNDHGRQR